MSDKINTKEIEELKLLLQQLGPDKVWRPIVTPEKQVIFDGVGDEEDGIISHLQSLDFHNKTVIDLGCNLGYFCFVVKKAGAAKVLGVDNDERMIRGCQIIKKLSHLEDIDFQTLDVTSLTGDSVFDVGMMIDFIGKNSIISGMLPKFLDALELVSGKEMILTIRPVYRIDKHLQNDTRGLLQKYSQKYLRGGCFYNMEYIFDRFRKKWQIDRIAPNREKNVVIKETILLQRKL